MRISKRLEKYKDMYPKTVKYIAEKFRKNRRCTRCGAPVLRESRMIDYPYQCMNCDEDLYHFEVRKNKQPVTDAEIEELVERTAELLLLDN